MNYLVTIEFFDFPKRTFKSTAIPFKKLQRYDCFDMKTKTLNLSGCG